MYDIGSCQGYWFIFWLFCRHCLYDGSIDQRIRETRQKENICKGGVLLLIRSSMPIIALGVVKLLWKMELKTSGASIRFQNKIDLYKYTSMFLFHNDDTYHQKVVDNFKDAFYSYQISLSGTNIVLNFFSLFCILILLLYLLYYIIKKQKRFIENKAIKWIFLLVIVQVLLYIYSLGAVYIANFDEYEAVNLASYSRYCNMTFLAVWIVLVLGAVTVISESIDKRKTVYLPVLFVVILLISPMKNVSDILNRDRVRSSIAFREPFEKLNYLIRKNCDGSDRIYFISQGDRGQDYWVTRFNARPNFVVTVFGGWNLGGPFYETDYETIHLTSSEWQTILLTENYDYVALYRLNDYFIQSYADLFMNPSDMVDNALFRVDKETGMLVRCEE